MNRDLIRKQIIYSHLKLFILYKMAAKESKKSGSLKEEASCLREAEENHNLAHLFSLEDESLDFDPFVTDTYFLRLYQFSEECQDFIDNDFNDVLNSLKGKNNV